jgi:TetR/AcrR family transcriptional regulator, lmrAB and yxaGH operons repressor
MSPSSTRRTIVEAAATLMERQGYHATGIKELLTASGTPRGSLYHHFPGGKEAVAVAAVEDRARRTQRFLERHLGTSDDPAEAVRALVAALAERVDADPAAAAPPFAALALSAGDDLPALRGACREAYGGIRGSFAATLRAAGWTPEGASSLATLLISAIDGAYVLARVEGDAAALRAVGDELAARVRAGEGGAQ